FKNPYIEPTAALPASRFTETTAVSESISPTRICDCNEHFNQSITDARVSTLEPGLPFLFRLEGLARHAPNRDFHCCTQFKIGIDGI
ncbi:hypothetical protein, partial [Flavobacterium sp.]|uniref:hypothetical protein n=1 Tax=Flavobacterium sp. TaxID=239 RepID=UPI0025BBA56A